MGCHRSVVFGSPAKSLRLQDDSSFWHYSKRCKLPEKGQQALKLYVPINIKEVKRGLIFLSPLHCIKKNTHPCKTLSLRVQKTGNTPRLLTHRGCNLSPPLPLVASPFLPLAAASLYPSLVSSSHKTYSLFLFTY